MLLNHGNGTTVNGTSAVYPVQSGEISRGDFVKKVSVASSSYETYDTTDISDSAKTMLNSNTVLFIQGQSIYKGTVPNNANHQPINVVKIATIEGLNGNGYDSCLCALSENLVLLSDYETQKTSSSKTKNLYLYPIKIDGSSVSVGEKTFITSLYHCSHTTSAHYEDYAPGIRYTLKRINSSEVALIYGYEHLNGDYYDYIAANIISVQANTVPTITVSQLSISKGKYDSTTDFDIMVEDYSARSGAANKVGDSLYAYTAYEQEQNPNPNDFAYKYISVPYLCLKYGSSVLGKTKLAERRISPGNIAIQPIQYSNTFMLVYCPSISANSLKYEVYSCGTTSFSSSNKLSSVELTTQHAGAANLSMVNLSNNVLLLIRNGQIVDGSVTVPGFIEVIYLNDSLTGIKKQYRWISSGDNYSKNEGTMRVTSTGFDKYSLNKILTTSENIHVVDNFMIDNNQYYIVQIFEPTTGRRYRISINTTTTDIEKVFSTSIPTRTEAIAKVTSYDDKIIGVASQSGKAGDNIIITEFREE